MLNLFAHQTNKKYQTYFDSKYLTTIIVVRKETVEKEKP